MPVELQSLDLDELLTQARRHIWEAGYDEAGLGRSAGTTAALRANAEAQLVLAASINRLAQALEKQS